MREGKFLVGLDIVGDTLMQINVFIPGGLESAEGFTGVRISRMGIEDLERKPEAIKKSKGASTVQELAALRSRLQRARGWNEPCSPSSINPEDLDLD